MTTSRQGLISGLLGITLFAGSLPATRLAVADLSPTFLSSARVSIAAIIALVVLIVLRQPLPKKKDITSLGINAFACVIAYPLLTAYALQHITAGQSIVFNGLLPLCTAFFAFLVGGEKMKPLFWVFAAIGASCVIGYALSLGGEGTMQGNLFMLTAVVICGLGYTEGAKLSRKIGGWQVMCWALVVSLPIMLPLCVWALPTEPALIKSDAWFGLGYVAIFSSLMGFLFWYRGLALGGTASVGQLQLIQPFIGLALAALVLNEMITWPMLGVTVAAIICVAGARKFA